MNISEEGEKVSNHRKKVPINVRQMEIDDLPTVFHLGEKLFTAQEVPNLYRTWDEYEVVQFFESDGEYCLIAEHEDQIVGFLLGTTVEKARSAWKYGLLVWLGVEPDFQKAGVAERLFFEFKDIMTEEGVRMLLVDTEADNIPALRFFVKHGFGKPQQHIYLTLNMAGQKKPKNGSKPK